jgi:hypothetical protein
MFGLFKKNSPAAAEYFITEELAADAYENFRHRGARDYRYPNIKDPRFKEGFLWPHLTPKFTIAPGDRVFTIGSCFARNIEQGLIARGMDVPVGHYQIPEDELRDTLPPHLLNEYTLSTMDQRVRSVLGEFRYDKKDAVFISEKGQQDLYLHRGALPVTKQRLAARRKEIDTLYKNHLPGAKLAIVTLGLIEAWYDRKADLYLNTAPPRAMLAEQPGRYVFRRLNHHYCATKLQELVANLKRLEVEHILLTVSPVPIEISFTKDDVIIANMYSKSVLRSVVEEVISRHPDIDYFPSYEIVMSAGTAAMMKDNIHPKEEVVAQIVDYMLQHYVSPAQFTQQVA